MYAFAKAVYGFTLRDMAPMLARVSRLTAKVA
jgi:hypothetical protein